MNLSEHGHDDCNSRMLINVTLPLPQGKDFIVVHSARTVVHFFPCAFVSGNIYLDKGGAAASFFISFLKNTRRRSWDKQDRSLDVIMSSDFLDKAVFSVNFLLK